MTTPTQVNLGALNGAGAPITLRSDQNPDGSFAMRASLEIEGAAVSATNPLPVTTVGATGTDASGAAPSIGNVLMTFTVTNPGRYRVQNQSAATLQVVMDDGATGTPSILLLAPGAGAGQQGGDTSPEISWFTGRIRVCGAAGSQFMARYD